MWGDSRTQALERLHEAIDLASLAPDGPARWGWASRPVVITSATLSLAEAYRFRDPERARELLRPALEAASDRHLASFLQRALGFLAIDSAIIWMPKACSRNHSSSRANSGPGEVNRAVMRAWPPWPGPGATLSRQPPRPNMRCASAATPAMRTTGGGAQPYWQTS